MHVFAFILKLTPIIGTSLISLEAFIGRLITREKLSLPEKSFLRYYIVPTLWGLDIYGSLTLIVFLGAIPILFAMVIRFLIQIYFSFGKAFINNLVNRQSKNAEVTEQQNAEQQVVAQQQITLSQNAQVAELETEYAQMQDEQQKAAYLAKLKKESEASLVSQVAYNRLTKDRERMTKQTSSSPNPTPNSTKVNPKSIPSSVSGSYNKTPDQLRPHKTNEALEEARLDRAKKARLAGQIASQKQEQSQEETKKIVEMAKVVDMKKEKESENKIINLFESTLKQKLDKSA